MNKDKVSPIKIIALIAALIVLILISLLLCNPSMFNNGLNEEVREISAQNF